MRRTGFKNRGKPLKANKPMNKVSKKRKAYRASEEGKAASEYMMLVKQLPCCACGAPAPSDAHHCKDKPPYKYNDGMGPYVRLPGAGMKSSDMDVIPLCATGCHQFGPNSFHDGTDNFHKLYGYDYTYIEQTRKRVGEMV